MHYDFFKDDMNRAAQQEREDPLANGGRAGGAEAAENQLPR